MRPVGSARQDETVECLVLLLRSLLKSRHLVDDASRDENAVIRAGPASLANAYGAQLLVFNGNPDILEERIDSRLQNINIYGFQHNIIIASSSLMSSNFLTK